MRFFCKFRFIVYHLYQYSCAAPFVYDCHWCWLMIQRRYDTRRWTESCLGDNASFRLRRCVCVYLYVCVIISTASRQLHNTSNLHLWLSEGMCAFEFRLMENSNMFPKSFLRMRKMFGLQQAEEK